MSEKNKQPRGRPLFEGYQPNLSGLKDKDGKPLQSLDPKHLKPPKGDTAIAPPKSGEGDKPSQS
jgi:hypothetical protein